MFYSFKKGENIKYKRKMIEETTILPRDLWSYEDSVPVVVPWGCQRSSLRPSSLQPRCIEVFVPFHRIDAPRWRIFVESSSHRRWATSESTINFKNILLFCCSTALLYYIIAVSLLLFCNFLLFYNFILNVCKFVW